MISTELGGGRRDGILIVQNDHVSGCDRYVNPGVHKHSEHQQEESHNIPPPPEGIYNNLETLSAAIKDFAQAQGYSIVTKKELFIFFHVIILLSLLLIP